MMETRRIWAECGPFVLGISRKWNTDPLHLSGNTTFKQQLALLSLPEKFPRILTRTSNPHTHLTRVILSGLKCTTNFAYRPSKHTNTFTGLRPRAWGLITRLMARSTCSCSLISSITFNQMMETRRIWAECGPFVFGIPWKWNTSILFIFCGNTRDQAAACFAFSSTKVSKNPSLNLQTLIRI